MTNCSRWRGKSLIGLQDPKMLVEENNRNHSLPLTRWNQLIKKNSQTTWRKTNNPRKR